MEEIRKKPLELRAADSISALPSLPTVNPNSYTGNYSNANQNQQNNTIAINVYPQQGQNEEAIGEAVALKLGDILDNYVMVT